MLQAAYLWEGLRPASSLPHPEIVLARARDILKRSLNVICSWGSVAQYFDDMVMRAQLIEMAAEFGERPAFLFGDPAELPAIASTNRRKRTRKMRAARDERVLDTAVYDTVNGYHALLNKDGNIDIDKLTASVADRLSDDRRVIQNLLEQVCKHADRKEERCSILKWLEEVTGPGKHWGEKRKRLLAAILYEICHFHREMLNKGSIDLDELAGLVNRHREFHCLGEMQDLVCIRDQLNKTLCPEK